MPFVLKNLVCVSLLAALAACSSSDDTQVPASGSVTKGPVADAEVSIYKIQADGSQGERVAGPFTTRADGSWSGSIPNGVDEPLMVVAVQGSYQDETTGQLVELADNRLIGVAAAQHNRRRLDVAVTPYTHALLLAAQHKAGGGADIVVAIDNEIADARQRLSFDPTTVLPANPTQVADDADDAARQYAALLGGFSRLGQHSRLTELVQTQQISAVNVVTALIEDMADGALDATNLQGHRIQLANEVDLPALSESQLQPLLDETQQFIANDAAYQQTQLPAGLGELFRASSDSAADDSSSGETSSGETSSGETSSGETSSGETSSGETSSGETSSGETSSGETSSGETSSGETSSGETSSGETSSGGTSSGETSSGGTSSGETSSGDTSGGLQAVEILQAEILQAAILQAAILQAAILQAEMLQAEILQAAILQAAILQAAILQAAILQAATWLYPVFLKLIRFNPVPMMPRKVLMVG